MNDSMRPFATVLLASAIASGALAMPHEEARRGRSSGPATPSAAGEKSLDRAEIVLADGRRVLAEVALPAGDRQVVEWRRAGGDRDDSAPFEQVVAIFWPERSRLGEPSSTLVLQSGERYPGRTDRAAGALRWMHPWLGPIAIDLERIRSIEIGPGAAGESGPRDAEGDRVHLANGDVLEGLVTELDRECVVESLSDGSTRRVPLEVVVRIEFLENPQAPGAIRLEARDGTVVDAERFRTTPSSLRELVRRGEAVSISIVPSGGTAREIGLPLRDFSALLLAPSRIESLAAIDPEIEAIDERDGSVRSWIPSPDRADASAPIGARDVEFSGPAWIRYRVARGSVLSALATLPDTMRRFGDFELVLLDGDREVLRHRFSRDAPRLEIAARIDSGELVLELREGRYGPVQDRLRLEAPLLIAPAR